VRYAPNRETRDSEKGSGMRILGIDFGEKRVGVAISDPLGFTAQGLETLHPKGKKDLLARLGELCRAHDVGEIVIGLPVNMNGSQGPKAKEVLALVPELEKTLGLAVRTWDERLTSREAGRLMVQEGLSRQKQRMHSDRMAATLILQNYLESKRVSRGEE
jgi:putative Holliday junction resolvase